jgi:hypothetical protein
MIAGAGAAYLSGGLGAWEFVACAVFTTVAYKGLDDYLFIGLGWIMHTCWDLVHHFHGHPIITIAPDSSAGSAIMRPIARRLVFSGSQIHLRSRENTTQKTGGGAKTAGAGRWII